MNTIIFSIVAGALISGIALLMKDKNNNERHSSYVIKIFLTSVVVVFVLQTYFLGDKNICQEIDVGEPPF